MKRTAKVRKVFENVFGQPQIEDAIKQSGKVTTDIVPTHDKAFTIGIFKERYQSKVKLISSPTVDVT